MVRKCVLRWTLAVGTVWSVAGCAVPLAPLTDSELSTATRERLKAVVTDQEPFSKPVDVYEAMARALKYNLDYHVEAVQTSLRVAELDLSHYSMLPEVVAHASSTGRNNIDASSSANAFTGVESLSTSTSRDRFQRSADLTFSWNILDFGLSYVRARQAADKVLIGEEMQRKVTHRLLEDVRTAYWRAASYERLLSRMKRLETRTLTAINNARSLADSRQTSLITSLTYERELVEIKRTIKELQRDLIVAKSQLAALMNAKPGTSFALAATKQAKPPRGLQMSLEQMLAAAVRDRAELRENLYQLRINEHEAHAAVLELLPGLQLHTGPNWDSNSFLLNNDWVGWGAKASWNLLKVFQYPAKRSVVEAQDDLLKARGLALTMAVITQVHVSRIRYRHYVEEVAVAEEYLSVQQRLVEQIRNEAQAERVSEQTLLREEMNTLVAEAKADIAKASLQSAYANAYASIGWDPYGVFDRSLSVSGIAASLRSGWFERGDFRTKVSQAN